MGGIEGENGVNWGIVIVARGFSLVLRWRCKNSDAISTMVLSYGIAEKCFVRRSANAFP